MRTLHVSSYVVVITNQFINIHTNKWDVITYPCFNFNGELAEPLLKSGHGGESDIFKDDIFKYIFVDKKIALLITFHLTVC